MYAIHGLASNASSKMMSACSTSLFGSKSSARKSSEINVGVVETQSTTLVQRPARKPTKKGTILGISSLFKPLGDVLTSFFTPPNLATATPLSEVNHHQVPKGNRQGVTSLAGSSTLEDFLAPADDVELSYAAMLADLCDLAYDIRKLQEDDLLQRHQLVLVTTSQVIMQGPMTREAWERQLDEQRRQRQGGILSSWGITSGNTSQKDTSSEDNHSQEDQLHSQARLESSVDGCSTNSSASAHYHLPDVSTVRTLSEAASLCAAAALEDDEEVFFPRRVSTSSPMTCKGSPTLTPALSMLDLPSLEEEPAGVFSSLSQQSSPRRSVSVLTFQPAESGANSLDAAHVSLRDLDIAIPNQSGSSATTDVSGEQAISLPVLQHEGMSGSQGEPVSPQAGAIATDASGEPPAQWFVADDPVTRIRYFVIQGSTTLEHWQINLQFEPVIFEDPSLGTRIHRGVYMAALKLYEDLLPLVRQHLASSPFSSIAFTGHSLGGSLSTVLQLLFVQRGILTPDGVSPTYTFGAPAVFCSGAAADTPVKAERCNTCALDCSLAGGNAAHRAQSTHEHDNMHSSSPCGRPRGLLAKMGLGDEHIVNVIMHRDIVPRAFVCDYTMVEGLLTKWMPSLKSLGGLQGPSHSHKSLYSFIGRIAVLQPHTSCPFVNPEDATHPHLPKTSGLFRMVAPAPRLKVSSFTSGFFDIRLPALPGMHHDEDALSSDDDGERIGVEGPGSADASHTSVRPHRPTTLKQAVLLFLNEPHPLNTLTDYASYGANGSISRYHNPRNYTLGLLALLGRAPHQLPPKPEESLQAMLEPACKVTFDPMTTHEELIQQLCQDANSDLADLAVSPEALKLLRLHRPGHEHDAKAFTSWDAVGVDADYPTVHVDAHTRSGARRRRLSVEGRAVRVSNGRRLVPRLLDLAALRPHVPTAANVAHSPRGEMM